MAGSAKESRCPDNPDLSGRSTLRLCRNVALRFPAYAPPLPPLSSGPPDYIFLSLSLSLVFLARQLKHAWKFSRAEYCPTCDTDGYRIGIDGISDRAGLSESSRLSGSQTRDLEVHRAEYERRPDSVGE